MPLKFRWMIALATLAACEPAPEAPTAPAPETSPQEARAPTPAAAEGPNVLFVVLDTVRADHLSLCGYERPTSPNLEALRERGAAWTCDAYAPGSWTLPVHASFFTGLPVTTHGMHTFAQTEEEAEAGADDGAWVPTTLTQGVFPLPRNRETLAETFGKRGYRSGAFSGNPTVSRELELTRGFDEAYAARAFVAGNGDKLLERIVGVLPRWKDQGGARFLFVNFADAHNPWPAVPEGLGWAAPGPELNFEPSQPQGAWARYVRGEMPGDEAAALRARLVDSYDYGVWNADRLLGELLTTLEGIGWFEGEWRLIVASDHGELLGEHGLLTHGHNVYEGNARVPLLYLSSNPAALPDLSGPISALHAYHLARDGALPEERAPVEGVAFPSAAFARWSDGRFAAAPEAAVWGPSGEDDRCCAKLTARGEQALAGDLVADPGEENLAPAADHPLAPALEDLTGRMERSAARRGQMEDAALELLRAAGYVE